MKRLLAVWVLLSQTAGMAMAQSDTGFLFATDLSIHLNPDWSRAVRAASQSILIWASTTGRDDFRKHRIWARRTIDFETFREPFVYLEKPGHVIDMTIVRAGDHYYRFTKDETGKAITMESSASIRDPWQDMPGFSLAGQIGCEGLRRKTSRQVLAVDFLHVTDYDLLRRSLEAVDLACFGGTPEMAEPLAAIAAGSRAIIVLTLGAAGSMAFRVWGNGYSRPCRFRRLRTLPVVGMPSSPHSRTHTSLRGMCQPPCWRVPRLGGPPAPSVGASPGPDGFPGCTEVRDCPCNRGQADLIAYFILRH